MNTVTYNPSQDIPLPEDPTELKHAAQAWIDTAAMHARNEDYWRERALKAEESKDKGLSEQWNRVQGQRQDADDFRIESYVGFLERLVQRRRQDYTHAMKHMQEVYGTGDEEDSDGQSRFDYLLNDYEIANKNYKEIFDSPPPADENGAWPMPYVSSLKDAEKSLNRRLEDLGRWVIGTLNAHKVLHHLAHNHVDVRRHEPKK